MFYFCQLLLLLLINISITCTQIVLENNNKQFIICNVCNCLQKLRIIECFPKNKGNEFKLQMVKLPEWTESFIAINISQSEFPKFLMNSNLRKLSIKNSKLQWINQLSLNSLPKIEILILSDNLIENLPKNIFQNLKYLKILDLRGNLIKEFESQQLFGNNKNKIILDNLLLSRNPFCPSFQKNKKIIYSLPLSRKIEFNNMKNDFIEINKNEWIFKMENSKTFNLSLSEIFCVLPFYEENWNVLEELTIDNNKMLIINQNSLQKLFSLKRLYFSYGNIFPEEFFLEWTKKPEIKLKYLKLRNTKIFNLNKLNKWTFCSKNMELLDIGNIGINGELNLRGCKKLKWLYADNNKFNKLKFGESFGPESLLTISLNSNLFKEWPESLLDVGHSLINLNLANNLINYLPENGRLLLTLFPKLEYLDLANNKLINFELKSSLVELSKPTQLFYLNLSNNQIKIFGNLINEKFNSIKILDLSNNKLNIFSSFEWLPSLKYLYLNQNNEINIKIINKNETNNSLFKINLNNCNIKLMPNFNKFLVLKELNLFGNKLNYVNGNLLPNMSLQILDLRYNLLNRIGWDWSKKQIEFINELKLDGNPLDCACPMPENLMKKVGQLKKPKGYICVPLLNNSSISHWQHPLEVLDFIQTIDYNINSFSQKCQLKFNNSINKIKKQLNNNNTNLFILFLLLIIGSLFIGILYNSKWNSNLNWTPTMRSSMLAYVPLYNNNYTNDNEENIIIDNV